MKSILDIDENMKAIKNILRLLPFAIVFVLSKYIGVDVLLIALIICVYYLGDWIAKWYFRRKIINEMIISFVSWINLISWIVPITGIFTASLAYSFYVQSKNKPNKTHRNLAIIGAVLGILNAVIPSTLRHFGIK